jgi:hypothetical protein
MFTHMRQKALWLGVLLGARALADGAPRVDDLAWLAGTWVTEKAPRTEERWTPPRGGTLLGTSRTIEGDRTSFFEFLRIEADKSGVVTYWASPGGRAPATPFRLVERSGDAVEQRVVFENRAHDFPQRISYRRRGDVMTARIEGRGRARRASRSGATGSTRGAGSGVARYSRTQTKTSSDSVSSTGREAKWTLKPVSASRRSQVARGKRPQVWRSWTVRMVPSRSRRR